MSSFDHAGHIWTWHADLTGFSAVHSHKAAMVSTRIALHDDLLLVWSLTVAAGAGIWRFYGDWEIKHVQKLWLHVIAPSQSVIKHHKSMDTNGGLSIKHCDSDLSITNLNLTGYSNLVGYQIGYKHEECG